MKRSGGKLEGIFNPDFVAQVQKEMMGTPGKPGPYREFRNLSKNMLPVGTVYAADTTFIGNILKAIDKVEGTHVSAPTSTGKRVLPLDAVEYILSHPEKLAAEMKKAIDSAVQAVPDTDPEAAKKKEKAKKNEERFYQGMLANLMLQAENMHALGVKQITLQPSKGTKQSESVALITLLNHLGSDRMHSIFKPDPDPVNAGPSTSALPPSPGLDSMPR